MKSLNESSPYLPVGPKLTPLTSLNLVMTNVKCRGVSSAFWVKVDWLWSLIS